MHCRPLTDANSTTLGSVVVSCPSRFVLFLCFIPAAHLWWPCVHRTTSSGLVTSPLSPLVVSSSTGGGSQDAGMQCGRMYTTAGSFSAPTQPAVQGRESSSQSNKLQKAISQQAAEALQACICWQPLHLQVETRTSKLHANLAQKRLAECGECKAELKETGP